MISNRPYMIRAMYDWIVDNHWTPHIQVDANYPGVEVPDEFVQDGVIVLNVQPEAVRELEIGNDWIYFKARFQGVEREVGFFPESVLAVFARENGQGMPFPPEPYPEEELMEFSTPESVEEAIEKNDHLESPDKKQRKKGHLSIVK